MQQTQDIFSYVTSEEAAFQLPIPVVDGYEWSMAEHIKTTILFKNSEVTSGKNKGQIDEKPVKNIIRPILNLQYRAEGFDVKDIDLYATSAKEYYKSFFLRKYHDKWAVENHTDTFIDKLVETYVDMGGVLVKKIEGQKVPEVVNWSTIAFCDQSDILSGPIAIKHNYSPDQLKDMSEYGWGDSEYGATITVDELITLARNSKKDKKSGRDVKTPGRYIEVYELHGVMPESYLKEDGDPDKFVRQMQIIAFYQNENNDKQGVCLFRGKEKQSPFKFMPRDEVFGRALGFGGAEELFEAQVWVNYGMIRKKEMLDAAAMTLYKSNEKELAGANLLSDKRSGDVLELSEQGDINQVDTYPRNIAVFDNAVQEWEAHAQQMGSAHETIMGESPKSGTPFALQQLVTQEAHSLHEYRKGKLAVFVSEIYRDWIIPQIMEDAVNGSEFLADLDPDELETITDTLVTMRANEFIIQNFLDGKIVDEEMVNAQKELAKVELGKKGTKFFIKILKDELTKTPVDVFVNIAGKQKYTAHMVDKLVNVFRQLVAAPQALDDPRMSKLFNEILEASGLSPLKYQPQRSPIQQQQLQQPTAQPTAQTAPLQDLTTQNG